MTSATRCPNPFRGFPFARSYQPLRLADAGAFDRTLPLPGEEAVEEAGPVLHPPEPGLDQRGELAEVAFGEVGQGALEVRPDLLDRVQLVCIRREPEHRQPLPGRDQICHRGADVGMQVVPHDDDGAGELLVRGVEQPGVVGLGESLALVLARPAALPSPRRQARHPAAPPDRAAAPRSACTSRRQRPERPEPPGPLRPVPAATGSPTSATPGTGEPPPGH
jgi:hypothetical protein